MSGTLFVVATPIGNLGDITLRAIETLQQADFVACEDTRHSEKLMRHLKIRKPLLRYDEHTHHAAARHILQLLESGKSVCLITDAGTPTISDPGSRLVAEVAKAHRKIVPIPGPSSPIAALSAAGITSEGFVFLGFLHRKKGPAGRMLREALVLGKTVVLMESPFRLAQTVRLVGELVPHARLVVARELTKINEEFIRGNITEILAELSRRPQKGENLILIEPTDVAE